MKTSKNIFFGLFMIIVLSRHTYSAENYCLQFDGVDDSVSVPIDVPETECAVSFWFKTGSQNCGMYSVVEFGTLNCDRFIWLATGNLNGRLWQEETISTSITNYADGRWHHVVHTFGISINGQDLYVDGQLKASGTKSGSDFNWQNGLFIGYSYYGGYFQGVIDDVRIYDRTLTASETQTLTLDGDIAEGLLAHWMLDDGEGNVAYDAIGERNGTLNNDPCWVLSDLMVSIQPDLLIQTDDESTYTGDNIYNDLPAQTKTQISGPNMTSIYDIRLQNDRVAVDRFVLTASATNEYWDVNYYEVSSGNDVTADITGAGWSTPILVTGGSVQLRLEARHKLSIPDGNVLDQVITSTSISDPNKSDAVKAATTFSANIPPPPWGATYTTNGDFDEGTLVGVEHQTVADQLHLSSESTTLPFIWVPNSNEGTVSKVDTVTGRELGRYRTGPAGVYGNPSRTTVDLYGNCWVGNRNSGTVVKIGLLENGEYIDRNYDGTIETSRDLNGDGDISSDEVLPWANDECVIYEVVLIPGSEGTYIPGQYQGTYSNDYLNPGPRSIAVDAYNNIWGGCYGTKKFYYIEGYNGQILKTIDVSSVNHTPYGAVMDENGILWSSGHDKNHVLCLNPTNDSYSTINLDHIVYGLAIDRTGHLFVTGGPNNRLSRIDTSESGAIDWTVDWPSSCPTGVACTEDGDVWTADRYGGTVTRASNNGVVNAIISVGSQPAGVAVDAQGKVWMVDAASEYIYRIDPDTNSVDLSKRIFGTTHYGYSDMTGIVSRTATTRIGTWSVVHNTKQFDSLWGVVSWNSTEPWGTSLKVRVRSSNDRENWSYWEDVTNYAALRTTPEGRYLEVKATFQSLREDSTPILYDLTVNPSPCCGDLDHPYPRSDVNKDCRVNFTDFALMAAEWLDCASPECD